MPSMIRHFLRSTFLLLHGLWSLFRGRASWLQPYSRAGAGR
jgi:hypothetical protein